LFPAGFLPVAEFGFACPLQDVVQGRPLDRGHSKRSAAGAFSSAKSRVVPDSVNLAPMGLGPDFVANLRPIVSNRGQVAVSTIFFEVRARTGRYWPATYPIFFSPAASISTTSCLPGHVLPCIYSPAITYRHGLPEHEIKSPRAACGSTLCVGEQSAFENAAIDLWPAGENLEK
jgi:hypothetical protein